MLKRICVFCGSSVGDRPIYLQAALELGRAIAERRLGLVYGGGNIGLMGALADAALSGGGEVIGVIPQALVDKELAHTGLTELRVVGSMHARKALMAELSNGFLALPGGYGTLEEFCEIVTWSQLGLHRKPCGLLNVDGFFNAFLAQIDQAVQELFIAPKQRELIQVGHAPGPLLDRLVQPLPAPGKRWIRPEET
jgi:uncharacterized protein (TIGR00730 family)